MLDQEHAAGWTEERTEILKKLWTEGKPASEVAAVLGGGVTRSGVIGKVHRLKLPARKTNSPPKRTPKQKADDSRVRTTIMRRDNRPKEDAIRQRAIMREEQPPMPLPVEDGVDVTHLLGLMQLSDETCRWPIGDPLSGPFGFCGDHTKDGSKYCSQHHRRAYVRL